MLNVIRAAMASALLAIAHSAVVAQALQPAASAASAAPTRAAPMSSALEPAYRSAFQGYKSHTDQPVGSWQKANDLVGRIGGWQAYAREGQGEGQPRQIDGKEPGMPSHGGMTMPPAGNPGTAKSPTPTSPATAGAPSKKPSSAPASAAARGATGSSSGHGGSHPNMKKP